MKFKSKIKNGQLTLTVKADDVSEHELQRFFQIAFHGFMTGRLVKKDQVEYIGPAAISLSEFLKAPVAKRDLLLVLEQLIVIVERLQRLEMPLNNVVLHMDRVYIHPATRELHMVYLPTVGGIDNLSIVQFMDQLVSSARILEESERTFVPLFLQFFRNLRPFDLSRVEQFLTQSDPTVVSVVRRQCKGESGFMTDKPQQYYEHYQPENQPVCAVAPVVPQDDDATGLLNENVYASVPVQQTGYAQPPVQPTYNVDDDATGLLNEDVYAPTPAPQPPVQQSAYVPPVQPTYAPPAAVQIPSSEDRTLSPEEEDGGTALLNEETVGVRYPTLLRLMTQETIRVDKPVFRIGKERSYVDYFVSNNIAVSRSHADIITRGDRFFVKDLNSKNHTFINDHQIPIHFEVELFDGDCLRLGNEEFMFHK